MKEKTVWELFDLSGKVALVTGATGYLGNAMAKGLSEAGAAVIISSRDKERAVSAAEKLSAESGNSFYGVEMDHLSEESINRGFEDGLKQAGRIDILVNNAHFGLEAGWHNVTSEEFNTQLSNATGYFLLSRLVHDHAVISGREASIIMLGSIYGMVGGYPEVYEDRECGSLAAYHALKAGVINMVRHLGVYWAGDNVRVNCLTPGTFPPLEKVGKELFERYASKSPMKRNGVPEEIKGAVVFLASEASSYMTGANLVIDGGWTAC
ncbi:MAG: SDR family oxidoreductase [Planctomycetes bacterium]|nr:SDR family oxidoreductase [Planctomycetota bacterium]MBL7106837.1 SDR family oxidoreductase [Phycisphaerae bacterium]